VIAAPVAAATVRRTSEGPLARGTETVATAAVRAPAIFYVEYADSVTANRAATIWRTGHGVFARLTHAVAAARLAVGRTIVGVLAKRAAVVPAPSAIRLAVERRFAGLAKAIAATNGWAAAATSGGRTAATTGGRTSGRRTAATSGGRTSGGRRTDSARGIHSASRANPARRTNSAARGTSGAWYEAETCSRQVSSAAAHEHQSKNE
jgi:hypothetical protein